MRESSIQGCLFLGCLGEGLDLLQGVINGFFWDTVIMKGNDPVIGSVLYSNYIALTAKTR